MDDSCTYLIWLCGQLDEAEVNAQSPLHITLERTDATATLFAARTDQSGLIGLIRHLHGLGLVFLSVRRIDADLAALV